jgi:chromosome segregation ATPase
MDLHHLHRQARQTSAARAGEEPGYSSKGQWDQFNTRKVASEAARWKGEHDKMREVSTQLAYKYEQTNQAYQTLKERHHNLRTNHEAMLARRGDDTKQGDGTVHQELALKVEKWRARCRDAQSELEATREKLRAARTQAEELDRLKADHREKLKAARAQAEELDQHREKLKAARAQAEELDQYREKLSKLRTDHQETKAELKAALDQVAKCEKLKSEIPTVRSQLQEAKVVKSELESAKSASEKLMSDLVAARKELKAAAKLQSELESTKAKLGELKALKSQVQSASGLQSELESTKSRLDHLQGLEAELPIVKEKLKAGDAATRANEKLKAELAAAHEKLRAATHAASTRAKQHATDIQTCANMLANAEQVLQACSGLYQNKESPLGDALADTTTELGLFLKSLSSKTG